MSNSVVLQYLVTIQRLFKINYNTCISSQSYNTKCFNTIYNTTVCNCDRSKNNICLWFFRLWPISNSRSEVLFPFAIFLIPKSLRNGRNFTTKTKIHKAFFFSLFWKNRKKATKRGYMLIPNREGTQSNIEEIKNLWRFQRQKRKK